MRFSTLPGQRWLSILSLAGLLAGCAGTSSLTESPAKGIKVSSDPAGATVVANGAELGQTPLQIVPGNHFRSGFVGLSYRYVGKLSVKKPGCETWSTDVNDFVLSKDIHAKLKCDPNYRAPEPASTVSVNPATGTPVQESAADRLERIENLRKKGLISDDEYKQLRARVLDKL